MDDFFSRSFGYTPLSRIIPTEGVGAELQDVDIYEKDDSVIVEAVVPGFTANDIKVEATPDSVQIEGERTSQAIGDKTRHHRRSRWSGFSRFRTVLPLPTEINPSGVQAKLEHGVLMLQMPKSEQARQKSVRVNVKER
jgi:HSP20 family protein